MDKLLERISSYDILNNLFPGSVLYFLLSENIQLQQNSILTEFFIIYFLGLLASRIGSLLIEPLCKKLNIIQMASYEDFIKAESRDKKIEILSSVNNMYRTFISVFIIYIFYKITGYIAIQYTCLSQFVETGIIIALLVIFSLSYHKQTNYIRKRVICSINNKEQTK
ncbi:MAG TPA: hypothetical protein H9953_05940 [Candidatus Fusicatenibacter intestinipullorum]|nr:hypothetical protein [Candidatus Fusicatenibacter intestinipullorum]